MISFKNIPHALATYFKAVPALLVKIEHGVEKVEGAKTEIEAVSAVVAGAVEGPAAAAVTISVENAAFAVLGALDAALKIGGTAVEAKLLDAGLDQAAIDAAKAVGAASGAVYVAVKGK